MDMSEETEIMDGRGDTTGVRTSQMRHSRQNSPTRMVPAKELEMIPRKRIARARRGNPPSTANKAVEIIAKYWRGHARGGSNVPPSMNIGEIIAYWKGATNRRKMKLYRVVALGDLGYLDEHFEHYSRLPQFVQGNTILHVAIQHRQCDMAEKILVREPTLLCGSNRNGDTPLHIAARIGNLDLVNLLLTSRNRTSEEDDAVQRLLETKNKEGDTALHDAIRNGHVTVVELLLEACPELTLTENHAGESPLFVAVDCCFLQAARQILQIPGISPSIKGRDSMNALHAAIIRFSNRGRQLRQEKLLIKGFPNTTEENRQKICADFMNDLITGHPSAMSEFDEFKRTPFHYAAQFGCDEVAKLLSKLDIDLARIADESDGMSALHVAAKNGHVKFIEHLLNYCPDICELLDNNDMTAIHAAVESGKLEVVEYFLKKKHFQGVINRKDTNGNTPLHLAAIHENPFIFLKLVEDERVDRSAINKEGLTAMEIIQSNTKLAKYEKDYMFAPSSLPRSLKWVSRTYVEDHNTGDTVAHNTGNIDTAHNIGTGDFENGATAGDIDIAGSDRYVRIAGIDRYAWRGRYVDDIDVVVATLIAAVTYQAALQTPGGYTQDEIHKGTAVLIKAFAFNVFVIADSLAFSLASASIFVHFWSSIEESDTVVTKLRRYARFMTNISIVRIVVAFAAGASVVLTPSRLLHSFTIVCCTCFFLGPIILFLRIMRATINSVLSEIVVGPIISFLIIMRATINSVLSGTLEKFHTARWTTYSVLFWIVEKFRRARHSPEPSVTIELPIEP